MAIVVSDTSAIRALHHLDLLGVIRPLYGELIVPVSVHNELRQPRRRFVAIDLVGLGIASVQSPKGEDLSRVETLGLDAGETEAIALALSIHADYLLIDEQDGRAAARRLGLRIAGVVAVLIDGKRQGQLAAVAPLLKRLRLELRFHIHPRLEAEALASVGEIPEQ